MAGTLVRDLARTIERLRAGMLTAAVLPVMLGACSVPDWVDPTTYFESDYGPAPQPVAQNGEDRALSRPVPTDGLVAARSEADVPTAEAAAEPIAETVAAAEPAAPPPSRVIAESAPPRPAEPQPAARIEAPAPPAPVAVAEAAPALPEAPERPRPASLPSDSPTPMIAAMTRGQTPPSFRDKDDDMAVRRPVATRREAETALSEAAAADERIETESHRATTGASTAAATTVVREAETSTSALAAPAPQPTLSGTYRDQLRAAGIVPSDNPPTTPPQVAEPGQFPSRVPAVIRQSYRDSLAAPKTYEQAIGRAPVGSGSSVIVGGDGPVVISSEGVYQQVALVGTPRTGAAATIQFGHNSAKLSPSDLDMVRSVAAEASRTGSRVRIVGHASSRTGEMAVDSHLLANLRISARRAEAVADALADLGVPYERIVVEARGDNAPIYNEAMPSGEAGNRRAEIYLEN